MQRVHPSRSPDAFAVELDYSRQLQDKTALVTGAAVGLGRAIALLFAAAGARLVLLDLDEAGVQAVASEVANGVPVVPVACDVSSESSVKQAVAQALNEFQQIDVVVNNAGVHLRNDTTALSLGEVEWERAFDVHAKGPFFVTRAVIPHMQERKVGSIVNVSSIGALYGSGGGHAYRASKAALLSLTRTLAIELAPYGIRVNALLPGAMMTPMREFAALERKVLQPEDVPLGRISDPQEVAQCALFLASDASSFVTGAFLVADGGQTAA
jgi:3-oxoacyl-[acyl-carrier protein] reductase